MDRLQSERLRQKRQRRHCSKRRGVSIVEFAVTLPVLSLLVFGTIEAAHSIQLKQGLTVTAYEAVMVATSESTNSAQVQKRAEEIAKTFQINDLKVSVTPEITPKLPSGTTVRVTVSAPVSSNRVGPNFFFSKKVLSVQATMVRL